MATPEEKAAESAKYLNADVTPSMGGSPSVAYGDFVGGRALTGADGGSYYFVPRDFVNKGLVQDGKQFYNKSFLNMDTFKNAAQTQVEGVDGFVWNTADARAAGVVAGANTPSTLASAYTIDGDNPAIAGIGKPSAAPDWALNTLSYVSNPVKLSDQMVSQQFITPESRYAGTRGYQYYLQGWMADRLRAGLPTVNALLPIIMEVYAPGTGAGASAMTASAATSATINALTTGNLEKGAIDLAKIWATGQIGDLVSQGINWAIPVDTSALAKTILTGAGTNAAIAGLYGRDVGKAFIDGGIQAGVNAAAGTISGFTQLPTLIQKIFNAAVTTSLQGKSTKEMDAATLQAAISAGLGAIANGIDANAKIKNELGRDATPDELNNFIWYTDRNQLNNKVYDYMGGVKASDAMKNGFESYTLDGVDYQIPKATLNKYAANQGWDDYSEKKAADSVGITTPAEYRDYESKADIYKKIVGTDPTAEEIKAYANIPVVDFQKEILAKTEEEKIIEMLNEKKIPPTPERVMRIMQEWDFDPQNPKVGFSIALSASDNLNVSNDKADSVAEAAALAKSQQYSNFTYAGNKYQINPAAKSENPYDFFVDKNEAYKAARSDLGGGRTFTWTDPTTGVTRDISTNNEKEQSIADQKRIDMMPVYGGAENTRTGKPLGVKDLFIDTKTGDVVQDTRVWDANGNIISGSLNLVDQDTKLGALNTAAGQFVKNSLDVGSGFIKGGADVASQIGTLAAVSGLANMDNALTRYGADIRASVDSMRSNEFKGNEKLMQDAIAKAGSEGFFAQAIEAAKQFGANPLQTAEFIARNGVSLLIGSGGMAAARALGAGVKVADAAAIATNAVTQGASVAEETYKDAIANGKTPEQAMTAARISFAASSATSALSNKFIPGALSNESLIAAKSATQNGLKKALVGELGSELSEETSGKIISNLASGNAWNKDLGSTAIQAMIGSGAITGLVHGGIMTNQDVAKSFMSEADINGIKNEAIESLKSGQSNFAVKGAVTDTLVAQGFSKQDAAYYADGLVGDEVATNAEKTLIAQGVPVDQAAPLSKQIGKAIASSENGTDIGAAVAPILANAGLDPSIAPAFVANLPVQASAQPSAQLPAQTPSIFQAPSNPMANPFVNPTTNQDPKAYVNPYSNPNPDPNVNSNPNANPAINALIDAMVQKNPLLTPEEARAIIAEKVVPLPPNAPPADVDAAVNAANTAAAQAQVQKAATAKFAATTKTNLKNVAAKSIAGEDAATSLSGLGTTMSALLPSVLTSKEMKPQFQDPLAEFQKLTEQPYADENQALGLQTQDQQMTPQPSYYSYGQTQSLDDIFNPPQQAQATPDQSFVDPLSSLGNLGKIDTMATGGLAGTRYGKYAGGGMPTPLMAAGGKLRVDFRGGDAVTGAGDGQSDDIPAMLADGEFVFPADVVAAIGNGSTKAGSDKLYDMMHGIRSHVRSAHPKDLPPEIKSPLDFLKTKPRRARS